MMNPIPCRNEDPDFWHPIGTSGPSLMQAEAAKAKCAPCPIKAACLDQALRDHNLTGIWGGTDERQRTQLRRSTGLPEPTTRTALTRALASR